MILLIAIVFVHHLSSVELVDRTAFGVVLSVGFGTGVWLFAVIRIWREVEWRRKARFARVRFRLSPKLFEELGSPDVIVEKREGRTEYQELDIEKAFLCGEFTRWDADELKMEQREPGGDFECEIALAAGRSYRYKFRTVTKKGGEFWAFGEGLRKGGNCVTEIVDYRKNPLVGWGKYTDDVYSV